LTAGLEWATVLFMVGLPNRNRIAERREATRREILDAAWAIAHESSIAAVTLREIADRIGMQPPSLYTHFESKNAVFDAMFEQAWTEYLEVATALEARLPKAPRQSLRLIAHTFFDFAVADLARHQLMNQRTVPDFTPTERAYQPAVEVLQLLGTRLAAMGLPGQAEQDLCVAIIGGLVDAQQANDPGGDRWERLLDRAIDMFADETGLPGPRLTPRAKATARGPARPARGARHERVAIDS
jgi:AcrR family transcriptional regulator